jgi:hypothetical protein
VLAPNAYLSVRCLAPVGLLIQASFGWAQYANDTISCPAALVALPSASNTTCRDIFEKDPIGIHGNLEYPAMTL